MRAPGPLVQGEFQTTQLGREGPSLGFREMEVKEDESRGGLGK